MTSIKTQWSHVKCDVCDDGNFQNDKNIKRKLSALNISHIIFEGETKLY